MRKESRTKCVECGGSLEIIIKPRKRGPRDAPVYKCKDCDRVFESPLRLSLSERKLYHNELFEIFKLSMTGILAIMAAIIVANFNSLNNQAILIMSWDTLALFGSYTFVLDIIIFNSLLEKARREIEILEVFKDEYSSALSNFTGRK